MNYEVKQVIVMRRSFPDGKGGLKRVRTGKMIAQACHASISFIAKQLFVKGKLSLKELTKEQQEWIGGSFAKIVVYVDTEQELLDVYQKALSNKMTVYLITDAGNTEFDGVPTKTCIAIGPHSTDKFDGITSELPLL